MRHILKTFKTHAMCTYFVKTNIWLHNSHNLKTAPIANPQVHVQDTYTVIHEACNICKYTCVTPVRFLLYWACYIVSLQLSMHGGYLNQRRLRNQPDNKQN